MKKRVETTIPAWRTNVLLGSFVAAALVLGWRSFDLQVVDNDHYREKGNAAHLRTVEIPAHRGMILDRNGTPLAISTPVKSIWAKPEELLASPESMSLTAKALNTTVSDLEEKLMPRASRDFVYLKRHVPPAAADWVVKWPVDGVYTEGEFRRYYPMGEVSAHLIGFTDVDDNGQEGVELAYDRWLRGEPGRKRVLQDRRGVIIGDVERLAEPKEGRDLYLSIDKRIQYLAYRALKGAVKQHNAKSASMVVLDTVTGEVLAMVNQPAFNPNARSTLQGNRYRNRAVTDVFEPGSTMKPFVVAAALDARQFTAESWIDTTPGFMYVGRNRVQDIRNYGRIDVTTVLQKSSNVGVSKMALALDREYLWNRLVEAGFGTVTGSGIPGEHGGLLNDFHQWSRFEQATVSFGYGLMTTTLQLARAYSVFANDGVLKPVSIQRLQDPPAGERVMSERTARAVRSMLETVVSAEGTAPQARIPGYRVAGKTGTVRKQRAGQYSDEHYQALFAGIAPASRPRLAAVVVVDEPRNKEFYGGHVAAPVFAEVIAGALRLMDIAPDDLANTQQRVAAVPGTGEVVAAAARRNKRVDNL